MNIDMMMMRTKSFSSTADSMCTALGTIQNPPSQVFVCLCDGGQKLLRTHDSLIKCQQKYFHVFIFDVDFALTHSECGEYFCFVHSSFRCGRVSLHKKKEEDEAKTKTLYNRVFCLTFASSTRATIPRARARHCLFWCAHCLD